MAEVTLKGNTVKTNSTLPKVGSKAQNFHMVKQDLSEIDFQSISGKRVLNIFPSIDTGTCAASVRQFNKRAANLNDVTVINLSKDLPFALQRFCGAEGIDRIETASVFRSNFAQDYGLEFVDGPLKGLCSRVIIVVDADNTILHTEQVAEIVDEPNYDLALSKIS